MRLVDSVAKPLIKLVLVLVSGLLLIGDEANRYTYSETQRYGGNKIEGNADDLRAFIKKKVAGGGDKRVKNKKYIINQFAGAPSAAPMMPMPHNLLECKPLLHLRTIIMRKAHQCLLWLYSCRGGDPSSRDWQCGSG